MADIYQSSSLNLAACAGNDSWSDLFPERDAFSLHICRVNPGPRGSLDGPWSVRYWLHDGYAGEGTA
jgi:hypothetical protein